MCNILLACFFGAISHVVLSFLSIILNEHKKENPDDTPSTTNSKSEV